MLVLVCKLIIMNNNIGLESRNVAEIAELKAELKAAQETGAELAIANSNKAEQVAKLFQENAELRSRLERIASSEMKLHIDTRTENENLKEQIEDLKNELHKSNMRELDYQKQLNIGNSFYMCYVYSERNPTKIHQTQGAASAEAMRLCSVTGKDTFVLKAVEEYNAHKTITVNKSDTVENPEMPF